MLTAKIEGELFEVQEVRDYRAVITHAGKPAVAVVDVLLVGAVTPRSVPLSDLIIGEIPHPVEAAQEMEREIDRKIAETCPHEHYWSAMFQMLECADCGKKFKPRTIPEERAAMQYNGRGSRNWTQTKGNSVTPLR